jgi:serine/threonine-protein kinase
MIGLTVARYKIVTQLGRGGTSTVYLGEHVMLGKHVAIKMLHDEYSRDARVVARFVDEARAAARVRHPGVVDIHDFGRHDDGRAYLVMELLEGESLYQRLRRGPLPEPLVFDVLRQAAQVLDVTHGAGVIHRDLKPGNLFLCEDETRLFGLSVKVLDFGVARIHDAQRAAVRLTLSGAIVGTPTYMAPEQCKSARDADARSDVYALGCIAFEMATGAPPFPGKSMATIMAAHANQQPPLEQLEPVVSPELAEVIAQMLVKKPGERLQSMSALLTALDEAASVRAEHRALIASHPTDPMMAVVDDTIVDPSIPEQFQDTPSGPLHLG